jgi:dipeptidyl aminopeptidase/acylaminoacyl peptidase
MRNKLVILFSFLISISLLAQQKRAISVDDLWSMKRIGSFDVSPDSKNLVFDLTAYDMEENSGVTNIWIIKSDGSGLRKLVDSASAPKFYDGGSKVFYLKDSQIHYINLSNNQIEQLTNYYPGISDPEISIDETMFLFSTKVYPDCQTEDCNRTKDVERATNKVKAKIFTELMYRHWDDWRGPKISHLHLFDIKGKRYIDINSNGKYDVPPLALGSSNDFSFSPTAEEVAFTMNESDFLATSTNNDIFTVKVSDILNKTWQFRKISVSEGNDNQPVYSPDGKYIAFCSMDRAGYEADKQRIMLYDRMSQKLLNLTGDYDLSADEIVWSKDSKSIYFTASNKIYKSIFKIDLNTKLVSTMVEAVVASSLKLSGDGKTLFFKNQRSTLPYEIFAINADKRNFRRITFVNGDILSNLEMNEVETFWCEGAEETQVQSIILKPPFFEQGKKYPMIFLIHGGPQGNWEDDFHYRWNLQMFASNGYVVVAPNPRGSTGYGQEFTDQISKDWGGKAYIDLMNSYDHAVNNFSFIDKNNTFAAGASYGGYMINWIEGQNNKFNALVSHAGVFNLESMYGTTEELWFPEWENGGTPWENRELYKKWSPHMFVENFKTPLLVIHGAYDFRVPYSQAMELFTSLQRVGVESKFLYFPDETHFVTKPQNAKLWWNTIFEWFEHYKMQVKIPNSN